MAFKYMVSAGFPIKCTCFIEASGQIQVRKEEQRQMTS